MNIEVNVVVGGQRQRLPSTAFCTLSYAPPGVVAVTLQHSGSVLELDCTTVDASGFPRVRGRTATVVIDGLHFGTGEQVFVTVRGVPCAVTSVTQTRIMCITELCDGACTCNPPLLGRKWLTQTARLLFRPVDCVWLCDLLVRGYVCAWTAGGRARLSCRGDACPSSVLACVLGH